MPKIIIFGKARESLGLKTFGVRAKLFRVRIPARGADIGLILAEKILYRYGANKMSERGSFVTQYIYCPKCLEAAKSLLLGDDKYLKGVQIPSWAGSDIDNLPIIAGKVGGLYQGEEFDVFEETCHQLSELVCCELRVAVHSDSRGSKLYKVTPGGWNEQIQTVMQYTKQPLENGAKT